MATNRSTEYIAIYPASPIPMSGVNLKVNLEVFRNSLVESFKKVLNEEKRFLLIRVAHTGLRKKDVKDPRDLSKCRSIDINESSKEDYCLFKPIESIENVKIKYLSNNTILNQPSYEGGYHTDPIIYYAYVEKGSEISTKNLSTSITYGENDVEPLYLWLKIVQERCLSGEDIDAYVLFNSTFYIEELKAAFQIIHGGFKALMWNPISCYDPQRYGGYCLRFPHIKISSFNILRRVWGNPHWIRGDHECEDVRYIHSIILMIIGDESSWFFSLPIAPPPLYFLVPQGEDSIGASKKVIAKRLGLIGDKDIEKEKKSIEEKFESILSNIASNLGLKEDVLTLTLRFLVENYYYENYYYGRPFGIIDQFKNDVKNFIKQLNDRVYSASAILSAFGATPQCIGNGNYSYLDLLITKDAYDQCRKDGSNVSIKICLSWILGLSILVLLNLIH